MQDQEGDQGMNLSHMSEHQNDEPRMGIKKGMTSRNSSGNTMV